MSDRRTAAFRVCLAGAVLAISYLAFTPLQHVVVAEIWDKGKHFAAFLVLAALLDGAWPTFGSHAWSKIGFLLGYGVLIECVQAFIPNRQFSVRDVLADILGVLAYFLIYHIIMFARAE